MTKTADASVEEEVWLDLRLESWCWLAGEDGPRSITILQARGFAYSRAPARISRRATAIEEAECTVGVKPQPKTGSPYKSFEIAQSDLRHSRPVQPVGYLTSYEGRLSVEVFVSLMNFDALCARHNSGRPLPSTVNAKLPAALGVPGKDGLGQTFFLLRDGNHAIEEVWWTLGVT